MSAFVSYCSVLLTLMFSKYSSQCLRDMSYLVGESNRRCSALESDALPTELLGLDHVATTYTVLITRWSVLLYYSCHIDEKKKCNNKPLIVQCYIGEI